MTHFTDPVDTQQPLADPNEHISGPSGAMPRALWEVRAFETPILYPRFHLAEVLERLAADRRTAIRRLAPLRAHGPGYAAAPGRAAPGAPLSRIAAMISICLPHLTRCAESISKNRLTNWALARRRTVALYQHPLVAGIQALP